MSLNFTAIQSSASAGSGNYAGFNLIQYNFTGYNMDANVPSNQKGWVNTT